MTKNSRKPYSAARQFTFTLTETRGFPCSRSMPARLGHGEKKRLSLIRDSRLTGHAMGLLEDIVEIRQFVVLARQVQGLLDTQKMIQHDAVSTD